MVNRHDKPRARIVRHPNRLLGVGVRANPGVVGSDGKNCQINRSMSPHFNKSIRKRGISGEQNAPPISFDEVSVVTAIIVVLHSRAPMLDRQGRDLDATDASLYRLSLVPREFRDISKSGPIQQIASASRSNDFGRVAKFPERAPIGVIEMTVGQQNDIDFGKLTDGERGRGQALWTNREQKWNPNSNSRKQDRIRENVNAQKIDQDGRMSEPGGGYLSIAPFGRVWFCECRPDRLPTFQDCFAPQIRSPSPNTRIPVARFCRHLLVFHRDVCRHKKINAVINVTALLELSESALS